MKTALISTEILTVDHVIKLITGSDEPQTDYKKFAQLVGFIKSTSKEMS